MIWKRWVKKRWWTCVGYYPSIYLETPKERIKTSVRMLDVLITNSKPVYPNRSHWRYWLSQIVRFDSSVKWNRKVLWLSCDRCFLRSCFSQCLETHCQNAKNLWMITLVLLKLSCTNTLSPFLQNIEIASSEKLQLLFALNLKLKPFFWIQFYAVSQLQSYII